MKLYELAAMLAVMAMAIGIVAEIIVIRENSRTDQELSDLLHDLYQSNHRDTSDDEQSAER